MSPTANSIKGAATERMVAAYLREQGFPHADRRLREGRADDQGDIDGVPSTVIQVKYVKENRYQAWVTDTLRQRDEAGAWLCLLVRRVPRKPVGQWEALMPSAYFVASFELGDGGRIQGQLDEGEAWTWMRMDLALAVIVLKRLTGVHSGLLARSLSTTTPTYAAEIRGSVSALFTGNESPPSATT